MALGHGLDSLGAGRINQAHHAQQAKRALHIGQAKARVLRVQRAGSECQYPLPLAGNGVSLHAPEFDIQRLLTLRTALSAAHGQQALRCPLHIDHGLRVLCMPGGHETLA